MNEIKVLIGKAGALLLQRRKQELPPSWGVLSKAFFEKEINLRKQD